MSIENFNAFADECPSKRDRFCNLQKKKFYDVKCDEQRCPRHDEFERRTMTNEKIYVVTQGCYSDYHIVAATLDKNLAEKIAAKFVDRYDECTIEEYNNAEIMLKPAWEIYFNGAGNVCDTSECRSDYAYHRVGEVYENKSIYYGGNYHIRVTVSADDLESAIKIAAEKRAQYLAEKLGL